MILLCALPVRVQTAHFVPLGACVLTARGAECWDMKGRPAPALAAQAGNVMRPYEDAPRVRYLVVREAEPYSGLGWSRPTLDLRIVDPVAERRLLVLAVPVEATQREATVRIGYDEPLDAPFDVPFREGAGVGVAGARFGVGKASEIPRGFLQDPPAADGSNHAGLHGEWPYVTRVGARMWRVPLGVDRTVVERVSGSFQALDRRSEPIEYVDRHGSPLAKSKALAMLTPEQARRSASDPDLSARAFPAVFRMDGRSPLQPAGWAITNVAPGAIKSLRVSLRQWVEPNIGPFPLDPLP